MVGIIRFIFGSSYSPIIPLLQGWSGVPLTYTIITITSIIIMILIITTITVATIVIVSITTT